MNVSDIKYITRLKVYRRCCWRIKYFSKFKVSYKKRLWKYITNFFFSYLYKLYKRWIHVHMSSIIHIFAILSISITLQNTIYSFGSSKMFKAKTKKRFWMGNGRRNDWKNARGLKRNIHLPCVYSSVPGIISSQFMCTNWKLFLDEEFKTR